MKCNGQKPRFTKKNNNENERKMIESWWIEATQLYGTLINYHTNLYALSSHDFLYGENPTKGFSQPVEMLAIAQMNNDALLLSKFGIQTDAELTVAIPIKLFAEAMGNPRAEPKSGDLIVLAELGWDRPGGGGFPNSYPTTQMTGLSTNEYCKDYNPDASLPTDTGFVSGGGYNPMNDWIRGPNVYQITERRDENVPSQINPLGAHVTWLIKCKRFDYSYEPNAPVEAGSDQVGDGTLYGKLSGGTQTPEKPKPYDQNTSDETKKSWDYSQHGNKDKLYGDYG